jgi:hypothetical protein
MNATNIIIYLNKEFSRVFNLLGKIGCYTYLVSDSS